MNRKRILVVDDDEDTLELFKIWLERHGYETFVAFDAEQALVMAAEIRPHVAVIDIGLPRLDGIELLLRLRKIPMLDGCRYLAVTAFPPEYVAPGCAAAGFDAFFEKPIRHAVLVGAIDAWCRR